MNSGTDTLAGVVLGFWTMIETDISVKDGVFFAERILEVPN